MKPADFKSALIPDHLSVPRASYLSLKEGDT